MIYYSVFVLWKIKKRFCGPCKNQSNYYSCAIDTLCDVNIHLFDEYVDELKENSNDLKNVLISMLYQKRGVNDRKAWSNLRYPLWEYALQTYPSDFFPKGRIDASLDVIFRRVLESHDSCLIQRKFKCSKCKSSSSGPSDFTHCIDLHDQSKKNCDLYNEIVETLKTNPYSVSQCCKVRKEFSSIELPNCLAVFLPMKSQNERVQLCCPFNYSEQVELFGKSYEITGGIKCSGYHYSCIVKKTNKYYHLDDLNISFAEEKQNFVSAVRNANCRTSTLLPIDKKFVTKF